MNNSNDSLKNSSKWILESVSGLLGLRARDVEQGHGSFVTMGFGGDYPFTIQIRGKNEQHTRAEWYLWITMGAWRIDRKGDPLAGCEDDREHIAKALAQIEGKALEKVEIVNAALDVQFHFEGGITFFVMSIYTTKDDFENWMLFMPSGMVLEVHPGRICIDPEDE